MATLTRTRETHGEAINVSRDLRLGIPSPFPTDALVREEYEPSVLLAGEQVEQPPSLRPPIAQPRGQDVDAFQEESNQSRSVEAIQPSIGQVQSICFVTLNDLLSSSSQWAPIVPDRRHSMPHGSLSPSTSTSPTATHRSSPLQTLISNLRLQDSNGETVQTADSLSDTELLRELRTRVDMHVCGLSPRDTELARTLVSLVSHLHRLTLLSPLSPPTSHPRVASWNSGLDSSSTQRSVSDPYSTLRRQVSDFQLGRSWSQTRIPTTSEAGVAASVEASLLWSLVDNELEAILSLCRTHSQVFDTFADHLPPDYDAADYDLESLPGYDATGYMDVDLQRKSSRKSSEALETVSARFSDQTSEKMKMDLEAVTLAIDRLYLVAPQLHNQRVELNKSKLEEMEKAKYKGKQRHPDGEMRTRELDRMLELIGKASERKLTDQVVCIDGEAMQEKMARARQKDQEKRAAFVDHLAQHSDAGRLHSQDAVFSITPTMRVRSQPELSQIKDPHAMLSLPEFIREGVPEVIQRRMDRDRDPHALLTLPEFIKETPAPDLLRPTSARPARGTSISYSNGIPELQEHDTLTPPVAAKAMKSSRSRSMSEPLSWFLPKSSSPTPPSSLGTKRSSMKKVPRQSSASHDSVTEMQEILDVTYVAEYHENLHHVLVFLTVSGMLPGINLEAEVVAPEPGTDDGRSRLLLRCGASMSPRLRLPTTVRPGLAEVNVVGGRHFQVKLAVLAPPTDLASPEPELDAAQFQLTQPTSFICASCSLPLVQAAKLRRYRDLPSEHWAELVDAWMCHADQKLHEHVQKGSRDGFWPDDGEALVGGSYLLLRESAVVKFNVCEVAGADTAKVDDWSRIRCICGAVIGRRQQHTPRDEDPILVYRLAKYAFRPVSPTAEPSRIPLSAFIVEDMTEFVHAHATYRFVIVDEEEEKPRILVWLFKPSMRISYVTPTQFSIPRIGSIRGAKVLYKLLGPTVSTQDFQSVLDKYPGFPQAEHLYYPFEVCRRLAAVLKESNSAYPESMRTMTGLDVGWLQRG